MAALHYWTGTGWAPISSGGGSTPGPQGPAGEDGKSINVFVQTTAPTAPRVGDHWINNNALKTSVPAGPSVTISAPNNGTVSFQIP
jgi:hypothetical protein